MSQAISNIRARYATRPAMRNRWPGRCSKGVDLLLLSKVAGTEKPQRERGASWSSKSYTVPTVKVRILCDMARHGKASNGCALPERFAALPERFAVWPQKDKKWHMERLLGALHRPCRKVHIIPYLLHHAACRLPKKSLCHKGLPGLSERLAARSKVQGFFAPTNVRRGPPFSRQRFVANLRPTATLSGNALAPGRRRATP